MKDNKKRAVIEFSLEEALEFADFMDFIIVGCKTLKGMFTLIVNITAGEKDSGGQQTAS